MDNDELKKEIINENQFRHCVGLVFLTRDWILFDILDIHDSNLGVIVHNITYKQVFDCINWIEQNREKFSEIKLTIREYERGE